MPPTDLNPFAACVGLQEASTEYFAQAQERISQAKKHKRRVAHQCTFCGRTDHETLRACSLCKSASYCNRECQRKDYKTRHRHECTNFLYPPLTRAFMTEPMDDEKYPQRPVFAHTHQEGVGCWVSVNNWVDCSLKPVAEQLHAGEREDAELWARQKMLNSPLGRQTAARNKAYERTLLTLSVLVQNRRKDNARIVVYGARSQLTSLPHMTDELIASKSDLDSGRFITTNASGFAFASVGIPEDPWDKRPRLLVRNVNGVDYKATAQLPPAVLDAAQGIVLLRPGDYVIYSMQFRVGNGASISLDFEALSSLAGFSLAWSTSQQGYHPLLQDRLIAEIVYKCGPANGSLLMMFDHAAICEYYDDYITKGGDAFVESHYGKDQADSLKNGYQMLETMGRHFMRGLVQDGRMDQIMAECEEAGLHEKAARFSDMLKKL
ncbi:hypothetical protein C8T65DRAFT_573559 [Cerioporus squamosus]|nr:hypothetical protein C8T65DRAFT_573559 [Cerioporus squamosus]